MHTAQALRLALAERAREQTQHDRARPPFGGDEWTEDRLGTQSLLVTRVDARQERPREILYDLTAEPPPQEGRDALVAAVAAPHEGLDQQPSLRARGQ